MTDMLRWVVIAEAVYLLGFAGAVIVEARKFKAPPRHVWWIAGSYAILVIGYTLEVWARLGDPIGYRVVVAAFAFSFGILAMWEMWRHYKYEARVIRHRQISERAAHQLRSELGHDRRVGESRNSG